MQIIIKKTMNLYYSSQKIAYCKICTIIFEVKFIWNCWIRLDFSKNWSTYAGTWCDSSCSQSL